MLKGCFRLFSIRRFNGEDVRPGRRIRSDRKNHTISTTKANPSISHASRFSKPAFLLRARPSSNRCPRYAEHVRNIERWRRMERSWGQLVLQAHGEGRWISTGTTVRRKIRAPVLFEFVVKILHGDAKGCAKGILPGARGGSDLPELLADTWLTVGLREEFDGEQTQVVGRSGIFHACRFGCFQRTEWAVQAPNHVSGNVADAHGFLKLIVRKNSKSQMVGGSLEQPRRTLDTLPTAFGKVILHLVKVLMRGAAHPFGLRLAQPAVGYVEIDRSACHRDAVGGSTLK